MSDNALHVRCKRSVESPSHHLGITSIDPHTFLFTVANPLVMSEPLGDAKTKSKLPTSCKRTGIKALTCGDEVDRADRPASAKARLSGTEGRKQSPLAENLRTASSIMSRKAARLETAEGNEQFDDEVASIVSGASTKVSISGTR